MCAGPELMMMFQAFTVASTVVSVVSQIEKGEQEQEAANFRAQQADLQAQQSEADAQAEREAGEVRAAKVRKQGRSTQSEAKAALAASGVEVTAGTPVKIESAIKRNYEMDAAEEILYGQRKGSRLDQNAQFSRQAGWLERQAGERAASAGYMGAFGSVLSGGAKIAGGWKRAAKPIDWGVSGDFPDDGTVRIA